MSDFFILLINILQSTCVCDEPHGGGDIDEGTKERRSMNFPLKIKNNEEN